MAPDRSVSENGGPTDVPADDASVFLMTMALAVAMVACQGATPKEKTPVVLGGMTLSDMSFSNFVAGTDTAAARTVTLTSSHFRGTNLKYDASSSNERVAIATATGSVVTVTPRGAGTANVTVIATATADDEEGTQSLSFTVTVTAPTPTMPPEPPPDNNAPRLKAGKTLPHHTDLLYGGSKEVDLSEYFTDDEDDPITYNAVPNDEGVVTTSVSGSMLTITVVNHGDTTIIVTATDSYNQSIKEAFDVTVINQAPKIEDDEPTRFGPYMPGDSPLKITVSEYFTDVEGDPLEYTAAPSDETAAGFVTVTGPDADSIITITAKAVGEAMITITATDGTSVTSHTLTVTVSAVPNVEPEVVGDGIPDQSLEMDFADKMKTLNLSMYFRDSDGPNPLAYEVSVPAMGMGMYANATVDGVMLTITAVAAGDEMITVTASDGRHQTSDTFTVMVTNPDAPTRTSDLPDMDFTHDDMTARMVTLSGYFSGATDYDVSMSGDVGVVTATVENGVLTLAPGSAGRAIVTVTPSNSGGNGESQSFTVTVESMPMQPVPPVPLPTTTKYIQAQNIASRGSGTITLAEYFSGAESYNAGSNNEAILMVSVSGHTLTLAPVPTKYGTAGVTVTPLNSDGVAGPPQTFDVTVQAEPRLKMDASLPDFRISLAGATDPVSSLLDLSDLFEDPDGSMTLEYSTETSNVKKVFITEDTVTTAPAADDRDNEVMAEGPMVNLWGRAVGTATITVTATDSEELSTMETFVVTVIATDNAAPTQGAATISDMIGADRLELGGGPKKVIDKEAINDYFQDTDLGGTPGDMLTFSVEYSSGSDPAAPAQVGGEGPVKVTVDTADKIADEDRVAIVMVSPDTWDGDPHGGEDTFTVTVTPKKGGAAQRIVIIATDIAGAQHFNSFQVQVNQVPEAKGAQEMPLTLGEVTTYSDATGVNALTVGGDADDLVLVEANSGYFSDKDVDPLTCNVVRRGDDIFAEGYPTITDNGTATITLEMTGDAATEKLTKKGIAYLDVSCTDGFERSPVATLTVSVAFDASIH